MKRALMILVWTAIAYLGSELALTALVALGLGITMGIIRGADFNAHDYLASHRSSLVLLEMILRIVSALVAATTFILALVGRLPGTKKSPRPPAI